MSMNEILQRDEAAPDPPPVVTIEATGGPEAIARLLGTLPPDSGLAFVVTHARAAPQRLLPELLQPHTPMPVRLIEETTPVTADHVYLIPPGRRAHVEGTHLLLQQPIAEEARDDHTGRQAFLMRLAHALRPLADATQIKTTATRILGEAVGASRALFAELHADGNTFTIERDYHIPDVPSVAGTRRLEDFGPPAVAELRTGRTLAVDSIETQRGLTAADRTAYAAIDIGAHITVPLVKHGRLEALLSIHHPTPRAWTPLEIALVEDTAERTWSAVAQARAEAARRETEQRFRQALSNSPVVFARVDEELRYEWIANPHHDFDPASIIGKRDDELDSGPGIEALVALKRRVLARGEQERQEITFRRSEGERTYDITATPVRGEEGRVCAVVTASLDITESKRAEEALRAGEARYRTLFESMDEGFFRIQVIFDENDRPVDLLYREANPAAVRILGADWTGRRLSEISPDFEPHWYEIFGAVAQTREPVRLEQYAAPLDTWYSFYVFPVGEPQDRQIGNIFRDITRRKRTEEALRESEEQQAFLLRLSDALHPLAAAAIIERTVSQMLANHLGVDRAYYFAIDDAAQALVIREDYAAPGLESLAGVYPPAIAASTVETMRGGAPVVVVDVDSMARTAPVEHEHAITRQVCSFIAAPVSREGRLVAALAVAQRAPRDWTAAEVALVQETANRTWDAVERARAVAGLRESERNFRAMADTIPQLAWMADETGWIFWYNRRWYEYTGTTPEEMEGWGWQAVHHPDHVERVVSRIGRCFATGEPWEDTFPLRGQNGEYRWFLSRALPIRDAQGRLLRWFGTHTDITEQREAEQALRESEQRYRALAETLEQRVQEQTHQVHQLASKLTLAEQEERDRIGRILHDDLQQQLYAVQLQLALLQSFCAEDDKEAVKAQLEEVQQELNSAIDTTRQLNVDLSPAILYDEGLTEAIGWLVRQMAEQYQLQVTVEAGDSFPIADKGLRVLLFQAVRELLFNVVKHAGRREAVVRLEREGEHLRVTVYDKGRGFDVAALTEEHHRGSGLTTIHHRLRLVGGQLEIRSAPRGGTRVSVIAPLQLDGE